MRVLTGHRANLANDRLVVEVVDDPGEGGACHKYFIRWKEDDERPDLCQISFQNGPITEVGVIGVTHEALLEILIDRLKSFQAGPFACGENESALNLLKMAQQMLLSRTQKRMERGVEGTSAI